MNFRLFAMLSLLLAATAGRGQYAVTDLTLDYPLDKAGFAFMTQTRDGIYWLGSSKGLIRYDGSRARKVFIRDTDSPILHDQNVQSAPIETPDGKLWVTTYSALHIYEPREDKFNTVRLELNGFPVKEDYRAFHYNEATKALWLSAGGHLWEYRIGDGSYRQLGGPTNAVRYSTRFDSTSGKTQVYGSLWAGPGLELFSIGNDGRYAAPRMVATDVKSTMTYVTGDGTVLVGGVDGLYVLESGLDGTTRPVCSGMGRGSVSGIQTGRDGEIYTAVKGNGLFRVDTDLGECERLVVQGSDSQQLFVDNFGTLWLSKHGGGFRMVRPYDWFTTLPLPNKETGLDLVQHDDGTLYLLTGAGRLYRSVSQQGHQQAPVWTEVPFATDTKRPTDKFKHLQVSPDALYVFGYGDVNRLDLKTNRWTTRPKPRSGLGAIVESAPEATYLVSMKGVVRQTPTTGRWDTIPALAPYSGGYFTDYFSPYAGLGFIEHQATQLWRLSSTGTRPSVQRIISLPADARSLVVGPNGTLYAATTAGVFSIQDTIATPLPDSTGLLSSLDVLSISTPSNGQLWLSTSRAIHQYNAATGQLASYDPASGLPETSFLRSDPAVLSDGSIAFLSGSALVRVNPEGPEKVAFARPYLTEVRVNDLPLATGQSARFLPEINKPYRHNTLDFGLGLIADGNSPYSAIAYQLEGHDQTARTTAPGTTIHYSNLPPGDYELRLTGINRNGLASETTTLPVHIAKPYWETWWFRLLMLAAFIAIPTIASSVTRRMERQRQQRLLDEQARLAAERDRIAGEVHDDLGGQISSILYLSEEMMLTAGDPDRPVRRIHELARNSLQNVRDIIFALDNRRATLGDLGEQLRAAGTDFFTDHHIAFDGHDDLSRPDYVLSSRHKRNLLLIVKECWHNTVKHAGAERVTLTLTEKDGTLTLTCTDDGRGFASPPKERGTGGFGLGNMETKAKAIGAKLTLDSAPGEGTTLTITWSLP